MRRCDSAAMVPNTSELLPEPDTPVKAVSRRLGSSMLTSARLLTRAPCTRMRSWPSAAAAGVDAGAARRPLALALDVELACAGVERAEGRRLAVAICSFH